MYGLLLAILNIYHENTMMKERLMQCKPAVFLILVCSFVPSPISTSLSSWCGSFAALPFPTAHPCPACSSPAANLHLTKLVVHPPSGREENRNKPQLSPACCVLPRTQGAALQPLDLQ